MESQYLFKLKIYINYKKVDRFMTDKVQAEQDLNDCDTESCLSIENEVV